MISIVGKWKGARQTKNVYNATGSERTSHFNVKHDRPEHYATTVYGVIDRLSECRNTYNIIGEMYRASVYIYRR